MGGQRQYNLLHDDKRMWSSLSVSLASMGRGSRSVNSNGAAVGVDGGRGQRESRGGGREPELIKTNAPR